MRKYKPRTGEARERYNEYQRRYRAAHPEMVRESRRRYILRLAERYKAAAGAAEQRGGDAV